MHCAGERVYELSSGEVAGVFERQNSSCATCLGIPHIWNTYGMCSVVHPREQVVCDGATGKHINNCTALQK